MAPAQAAGTRPPFDSRPSHWPPRVFYACNQPAGVECWERRASQPSQRRAQARGPQWRVRRRRRPATDGPSGQGTAARATPRLPQLLRAPRRWPGGAWPVVRAGAGGPRSLLLLRPFPALTWHSRRAENSITKRTSRWGSWRSPWVGARQARKACTPASLPASKDWFGRTFILVLRARRRSCECWRALGWGATASPALPLQGLTPGGNASV